MPPQTARDMRAFVERGQTRLRQFPLPDKNPLLESLHHDCLRASGEANCKGGRSVARNWRGLLRGPLILHFVALHVLPRTLPPVQNITIQQEPQLRFRQKPNSKVR